MRSSTARPTSFWVAPIRSSFATATPAIQMALRPHHVTGAPGIPFGLSPTNLIAGQSIQFLGINSTGSAGIFRPGDESGTQFFFRSAIDPTKINLTVITADDPRRLIGLRLRTRSSPTQ